MGKGLPWYVIVQFLIYSSATIVPIVVPLAILLGSIMTFGTLAENFELTAMKSSGLSLLRIMRPLIILIFLTAIGEFIFLNNVWPVSNLKLRTLIWDITKKKPSLSLTNNVFYNGLQGVSIRVNKNDLENDRLEGILLYFSSEDKPGNNRVIRAEWGSMRQSEDGKSMNLTLYNGYEYQDLQIKKMPRKKDNTFELLRSEFDKVLIRIDLSNFDFNNTDEDLFSQYYEMLNMKQLKALEDSLTQKYFNRKLDFKNYLDKGLYLRNDKRTNIDSVNQALISSHEVKGVKKIQSSKKPIPGVSFYKFLEGYNNTALINIAKNLTRNTKNYLKRSDEEFKNRQKYITRYQIERHRKIMLSIACIVLFFIGAPLGAIIRKGGFGFPVVFSIIFFLIFHITTTAGEKMAKQDVVPVYFGMWLGIMVLLPFSIFLTNKAINDSAIMDSEFYKSLLKPIKRIFRNKTES
jgi:lipopolysaccharide export system permease protein